MKISQSLFEYVGNPLYKSDNAREAGAWRIYWHGLLTKPRKISSKQRHLWHYHLSVQGLVLDTLSKTNIHLISVLPTPLFNLFTKVKAQTPRLITGRTPRVNQQ